MVAAELFSLGGYRVLLLVGFSLLCHFDCFFTGALEILVDNYFVIIHFFQNSVCNRRIEAQDAADNRFGDIFVFPCIPDH